MQRIPRSEQKRQTSCPQQFQAQRQSFPGVPSCIHRSADWSNGRMRHTSPRFRERISPHKHGTRSVAAIHRGSILETRPQPKERQRLDHNFRRDITSMGRRPRDHHTGRKQQVLWLLLCLEQRRAVQGVPRDELQKTQARWWGTPHNSTLSGLHSLLPCQQPLPPCHRITCNSRGTRSGTQRE